MLINQKYESELFSCGDEECLAIFRKFKSVALNGYLLTLDDIDLDFGDLHHAEKYVRNHSDQLVDLGLTIPEEFLLETSNMRTLKASLLLKNGVCYCYDNSKKYGYLVTQSKTALTGYLKCQGINAPDNISPSRSAFQELRDGKFMVYCFNFDMPNYCFWNQVIDCNENSGYKIIPMCAIMPFRSYLLNLLESNKVKIDFSNVAEGNCSLITGLSQTILHKTDKRYHNIYGKIQIDYGIFYFPQLEANNITVPTIPVPLMLFEIKKITKIGDLFAYEKTKLKYKNDVIGGHLPRGR